MALEQAQADQKPGPAGAASARSRLVRRLLPGRATPWILAAVVAGGIFGLGGFTFFYGQGHSYLSDSPETCVNCHAMREVYEAWSHSSHKAVASCNDCHTPHTFPAKYVIKGLNGFNHSLSFTLDNYPEAIQIRPLNRRVAQDNCLYCHSDLVSAISREGAAHPTDCLRCHAGVGH